MPEVSRDQFDALAKRLHTPDGGFSIRLKTGFEPSSGFMVSRPGSEESHVAASSSAETLHDYADRRQGELSPRGRYFGGWHDPTNGVADLDVSERYVNHDRARLAMWAHNQKALFNLNEGRSERNHLRDTPLGPKIQKAAKRRLRGR